MEEILKIVERYVQDTLGLSIRIRPWRQSEELPFYLRDYYSFHEVVLLGAHCILMVSRGEGEDTPATLRKHIEYVQNKWNRPCIYVRKVITAYNRKRLIEQRVPFIIPGNQMYLPELAIDLREHFRKMHNAQKPFSPATQVVIIHALLSDFISKIMPSNLAKQFGYSAMTMTRSLDELEAVSLGEVRQEGRERWLYFTGNKRALWEKAQPLMQNPVRKRTWIQVDIQKEGGVIEAGLSALSHYSALNKPINPVFAISSEGWKILKQSGIDELPYSEKEAYELEVWSYNPALFARNGIADPFSLHLSLQEIKDERVESALGEMMERIKW